MVGTLVLASFLHAAVATALPVAHTARPAGLPPSLLPPTAPVDPVRRIADHRDIVEETSSRGFWLGMGFGAILLGLALGGAGFAILSECGKGTACYSEELEIVGWVLAAPGILPLAAGSIIVYVVLNSDGYASHSIGQEPQRSYADIPRRGPPLFGLGFAF